MRNFRFRLDPVIRLKKYKIEQIEDEINEMESQVQKHLYEIEKGRQAVQTMRQRLLDGTPDSRLIQAEQSLDLFRQYSAGVETKKQSEIEELRQKQVEKRQELIKLYQDEKVLERLKEKRKADWEKEVRREEAIIMDEIGTQKYIRKQSEFGGILLYLLVPLALIAAIGGAGLYSGVIDRSMLQKIPYVGPLIPSVTKTEPAAMIASATPEYEDTLTMGDFFGPPDTPMPEVLQNIMKDRIEIEQRQRQLAKKEEELKQKEVTINELMAKLANLTKQASDVVKQKEALEKRRQEQLQSELAQQEETLSQIIGKAKEKEAAKAIIDLYNSTGVIDPEEIQKNKILAIRLVRRIESTKLSKMIKEMQKADAIATTKLLSEYAYKTRDELYGIQPDPPAATGSDPQPPILAPTGGGT